MGTSQRILEVVIRAKDETAKGLASAQKHVDGNKVGAIAAGVGVGAVAIAAAAATAVALNSAADAAGAYGMQVRTVQRLTNASAAESSKWAAIMGRFGIEGKSMGLVVKSLDTAIVGNNKALLAAGIATKDASGHNRSATAVLADLAQYYSTATDKTAATALAAKVLGRGFMSMLPVLAGGKAGIDELTASAQKNGLILSQDAVNGAASFAKATKDAEEAGKGLEVQVGLLVLPIKTQLMVWITKVIQFVSAHKQDIIDFFKRTWQFIKPVIDGIVAGFRWVIATWQSLQPVFQKVWAFLKPIFAQIIGIVQGAFLDAWNNLKAAWVQLEPQIRPLMPVLKLIGATILVAVVAPMVILIAIVVAVVVVFAKIVQAAAFVIRKFVEFEAGVQKMWNAIGTTVKGAVDKVVGFMRDLPSRVWGAIKNMARTIAGPIQAVIDLLAKLNPFQRHSPSLVDNVIAGTAVIAKAYAGLGGMHIAAPVLHAPTMPTLAFAGGGSYSSSSRSSDSGLNARLVAVLERLERNGVSANLDGRLVSRGLGVATTLTGRSGSR